MLDLFLYTFFFFKETPFYYMYNFQSLQLQSKLNVAYEK